jgi:lactoylglutathione lyase
MEVIHTALVVSDMDKALTFYVDVLGLKHHWEFEDGSERNVYVGGSDGATLQLSASPVKEPPDVDVASLDIGSEHVAILVDDLDAVLERATEAGSPLVVEPTELELDSGHSRIAFLADPDGHAVELVQRLEGNPPRA